jgi:2-amino-4-hydroxy-6-hydroxymethyldihydropteridine diphosphokinase
VSARGEGRDIAFGLGGNIGDSAGAVREAFARLAASGLVSDLRLSSLWRTPPWGKTDQAWFINAVAAGVSAATPQDLLALALRVERDMGRLREERWGPRIIDVDLLYVGDEQIAAPGLTLPHPHMAARGFVIAPLAELRPGRMIAGRSAADRARDFSAEGMQRIG